MTQHVKHLYKKHIFCPVCKMPAVLYRRNGKFCGSKCRRAASNKRRCQRYLLGEDGSIILCKKKDIRALEANHPICSYCDTPIGSVVSYKNRQRLLRLRMDHFLPLVAGGKNEASNLKISCDLCNSLKAGHVFQDISILRSFVHLLHEKGRFVILKRAGTPGEPVQGSGQVSR